MIEAFKNYLNQHDYSHFDLKAVLFDMDGVLYDSMKWHAKSWKQTMDEFGINSDRDEFYLYEGMVGRNTIDHLIRREKGRPATTEEKETIYKRKTELFTAYNDGSLISSAKEFVQKIDASGLKCVVVTGSGQPSLIKKLDENFEGIFKVDMVVSAFDVTYGKPHPEPYLKGLQKAGGLNPWNAIVIENAPRGVEAAVAANIFTIAINTGPLDEAVLWNSGANIVLPSMKALYDNWDLFMEELTNL